MSHPPIPPSCPHFSQHDYRDGRGLVDIFWCSKPFWSHDHGEPWMLSALPDKGAKAAMSRTTVASVAFCAWYDEAARIHREPYADCRLDIWKAEDNAKAWKTWGQQ